MVRRFAGLLLGMLVLTGPAWADGDAAEGEKVFAKCRACHSAEPGKNGVGPSLAGVFGRKSGTLPGFTYSKAMVEKALVWDEKTLAGYLTDPGGNPENLN